MPHWIAWIAAVAMLLAGCASSTPPPQASARTLALLDDAAFGTATERIDTDRLFQLDAAMQAWLTQTLARAPRRQAPQKVLVTALAERNDLQLRYDAGFTRPATDTFAARRGNCLSLVILTSALAKALDLEVDYRTALVDDTWTQRANLLVASQHVNISLTRRTLDRRMSGDDTHLTIDFLPPAELQGLRTRPIDEDELVAMYLNNRAVEALADGRPDDAYAWVRAALLRRPTQVAAINTLGVLLQRAGRLDAAERAFGHALALAPQHAPAQANLAGVLAAQGRDPEAPATALP